MYQIRMIRERNAKLPYTVALILVFWVSFLWGINANANEDERICKLFGDMTYQLAKKRDQGWSIFEVRSFIFENFDRSIQDSTIALAEKVYQRPWMDPNEEARQFVIDCYRLMGLSGTSL